MDADPAPLGLEDLLQHSTWLATLARKLVQDPAGADDLIQDTWLLVLRGRRPKGPVRPWLARVLRNLSRDRIRNETARRERERAVARAEAQTTSQELSEQLEAQHLLVAALRELAEPFRSTVVLHYARGLACAEIARRQGVPAGTVRWRLKRGLDELRARLDTGQGGREAWCAALLPLAKRSDAAAAAGASFLGGVLTMSLAPKLLAAAAVVAASLFLVHGDPFSPWGSGASDVAVEPVVLRELPAEPVTSPLAERRVAAATPAAGLPETAPATVRAGTGQEPTRVRARLIDPHGTPLAGLELRSSTVGAASAASNSEGRVELVLDSLRSGQKRFQVASARHARRIVEPFVERGSTVELGDLVLEPGGVVSGRVQDEHGAAVAQAQVWLEDSGLRAAELRELGAFLRPSPEALATATDGEGRFELVGVPVGHVRLAVSAADLAVALSGSVEVREGHESSGVVLTVRPLGAGSLVRGIVLAPDGSPVAFAEVRYTSRLRMRTGSGTRSADQDGRFQIPARPGQRFDLQARDREERYGGAEARGVLAEDGPVTLRLASARQVEIAARARTGALLEPTVFALDTEGRSVLARAKEAGGKVVLTAPAGRFGIHVHAEGFRSLELGPFRAEDLPALLEVELEALPLVRGRVLAADAPVAGAKVRLFAAASSRTSHNGFPVRVDPAPLGRATTDEDGHFAAPLSRGGTIYLRAEAEGYAPAEHGPLEVDGEQGQGGVELRLTAGGAIAGRVMAAPGREPGGIVVGLSRGDAQAFTLRTLPDGSFRAEHLTPGPWQVQVVERELVPGSSWTDMNPGRWQGLPSNCTVEEGRTAFVRLGGAAAAELRGRLTVDGAPPGAWRAQLLPLGAGPTWGVREGGESQLDAAGEFRFSVLEPSRMRLILMAFDGPCEGLRLISEVEVGFDARWELDLGTGALDTGSLPANPLPHAQWLLVSEPRPGVHAILPAPSGPLRMPKGRARLVRYEETMGEDPSSWPTTRVFQVR